MPWYAIKVAPWADHALLRTRVVQSLERVGVAASVVSSSHPMRVLVRVTELSASVVEAVLGVEKVVSFVPERPSALSCATFETLIEAPHTASYEDGGTEVGPDILLAALTGPSWRRRRRRKLIGILLLVLMGTAGIHWLMH